MGMMYVKICERAKTGMQHKSGQASSVSFNFCSHASNADQNEAISKLNGMADIDISTCLSRTCMHTARADLATGRNGMAGMWYKDTSKQEKNDQGLSEV